VKKAFGNIGLFIFLLFLLACGIGFAYAFWNKIGGWIGIWTGFRVISFFSFILILADWIDSLVRPLGGKLNWKSAKYLLILIVIALMFLGGESLFSFLANKFPTNPL
jgi:hypothetical protein